MPRSPVEALHHILFLDFIQVKWGLVELQIMLNPQPSALIKYARSPSSLLSPSFTKHCQRHESSVPLFLAEQL